MATASISHLQRLQALLQALGAEGIELEMHRYDASSFGTFSLVLAKGHTKARFTWDGKESILTVEWQKTKNETIVGEWEHDAFIQVPTPASVFAEIGSNAEAILL